MWTSLDGIEWEKTTDLNSLFASETWLDAVATDGSKILAVGRLQDDGVTTAVGLWRSDDGSAWSEISLGDDFTGGFFFMDIASTPSGWVIVGNAVADGEQVGSVWHSADGEQWELVLRVDPGLVSGVTATDTGAAMVGGAVDETGTLATTIWTSDDGRSWTVASGAPPAEPGHELATWLSSTSIGRGRGAC